MDQQSIDRRHFLRQTVAALAVPALAGLSGCACHTGPAASTKEAPALTDTDILGALQQFVRDNPKIEYTPTCVHGINCQATPSGGVEFVFLLAKGCPVPREIRELEDSKFRIKLKGREEKADVRIERRSLTMAHAEPAPPAPEQEALRAAIAAPAGVRIGTICKPVAAATQGAVGWNVLLNTGNGYVPICVTSSHIMSPVGSVLPAGTAMSLDGKAGTVFRQVQVAPFVPGGPAPQNIWDCGMIEYTNRADQIPSTICPGNYPNHLVTTISTRDTFKKAGPGSHCTIGSFTGFGNRFIQYPGGKTAFFVCQLIFSAMSKPADSGAVIVDGRDGVVGMVVGGDNESVETCANPLYLWLTSSAWVADQWMAVPGFPLPGIPKFIQQREVGTVGC